VLLLAEVALNLATNCLRVSMLLDGFEVDTTSTWAENTKKRGRQVRDTPHPSCSVAS